MRFFASFGMGRDWDGQGLKDSILELCQSASIRTAEFFLFTPYPGSPQFNRLKKQGRILHYRWNEYNGAHVVWRPLGMAPDELYGLFVELWQEFFKTLSGEEVVKSLEPDQSEAQMTRRRLRVSRGEEI